MHRRDLLHAALASSALAAAGPLRALAAPAQPPAPALQPNPRPRIAFGGIGVECSTYSRIRTRLADFTVLRGPECSSNPRFAFLRRYPTPFLPTLVATAVDGGPITPDAYATLKQEFLDRLRKLLPLDGLYLAMHGAMFVEGMEDAEGDWYTAAREVVGPRCLLSASYDLHGNLSQRCIDTLDMLSAFRTAPHIDREETMLRATGMLTGCLAKGIRPTLLWAPIPVLLPGERTSTVDQPGKRLWAELPSLNAQPGILDVSLLVGYVWADEPRSTAAAVVTGTNPPLETQIATHLAEQFWQARRDFQFGTETCSLDACIAKAMASKTQPAILADSGDNPTGGGNGDQATVLQVLLDAHSTGVIFAGIADRPATDACYAAGIGKTIPLSVGATLDPLASRPVHAPATVRFLLPAADPTLREAVVQMEGVTLVLSASRRPYHDIADFTRLGLDPRAARILVVKSGYLSPELAPLANPSLMALTDGAINQDIVHLPPNRRRVPTFPFVDDLRFTPRVHVSARAPQIS